MVLPWATDNRSPSFRKDLLGCPYFDAKTNELIFAINKGYSLNLIQSSFSKLRNPPMERTVYSNKSSEDSKNIASFRKEFTDTFVPTSLLKTCLNEFGLDDHDKKFSSKLLFRRSPYLSDQFMMIYPDISGKKMVIDYLNEMEIGNNSSGLSVFDTNYIDFCFPIQSIKSHKDSVFAAASNQTIRLYSIEKDSIDEIFECITPEQDYFLSFDISRNSPQICAILKNNRKLTLFNELSSQSYNLSGDYYDCAYTLHPSLVALSGNSNNIELKDIRGTFPGLFISDQHVPFHNVQALTTHEHDNNLIAISCKTDAYSHISSNYAPVSELRIYDFRYPKESTMRIATDSPIVQFIAFDSFIEQNTDNLIALDSASNLSHWEFRHSKSNIDYSDGILSMADCSRLFSKDNLDFPEDGKFIGLSTVPSFLDDESFFIARLTDDGEIDYCKICRNESDAPYSEPLSPHEETEEILDLTYLSDIYSQKPKISENMSRSFHESFGPLRQSTFHLDFYWDELKAKIHVNPN